ncbi:MAG: Nif11-like leader peptide family natural product precursor [Cloacibacillus sp.]
MSRASAVDFVKELIKDPERLLKISKMRPEEIGDAVRGLGYDFTERELEDYICAVAYILGPQLHLGDGDFRDIIMQLWGRHMPRRTL